MRSLDFFRLVVAPNISGPTTDHLWTAPVLQLSIQDVTARDAVLAISLLYEASLEARDHRAVHPTPRQQQKNEMASRYYGRSLRRVATAAATDLDAHLVLFLSILYMSVDFLRGHEAGAIAHCRHALRIAQTSSRPPPTELVAVLSHLNVFPFFFGATLSDFPLWNSREDPLRRELTNMYEVSASLDRLMARTVGLLREFDPFRLGTCGNDQDRDTPAEPHSSLIARWCRLCQDLDAWSTVFFAFQRSQPKITSKAETAVYRTLEMRWRVTRIWASCLGEVEETAYDKHQDQFERIVELAREEDHEKQAGSNHGEAGLRPVFRFEMGVLPLLHFVAIKCRSLALRLEALVLMRRLGCPREALWDARRTYAIGRRIVEREHDLEMAPNEDGTSSGEVMSDAAAHAPKEDKRIRDSYLGTKTVQCEGSSGATMLRQEIVFFMYDSSQSKVIEVRDWIHYSK